MANAGKLLAKARWDKASNEDKLNVGKMLTKARAKRKKKLSTP